MHKVTTSFRVRHTKPQGGAWFEIQAQDAADAAQAFHLARIGGVYLLQNGSAAGAWYSLIEVADHGKMVSRIFVAGIGRAGGVSPRHHAKDLPDVARRLGVELKDLVDDWVGEQTEWAPLTARNPGLRLANVTA